MTSTGGYCLREEKHTTTATTITDGLSLG